MKKEALIQIRELSVSFRNRNHPIEAVRGISFDIPKASSIAIVGESGSGKSTLAKSLLNLFPKQSISCKGEVFYKGKNLLLNTEKEWRQIRGKKIGFVFQEPLSCLNPSLTVGYQLMEAYTQHNRCRFKQAREKALDLLHLVGIVDPIECLKAYPHVLSGGMRQRVLIAIALACDPELLIADEPTTGLDASLQIQILQLLKSLQNKLNMSLLLITHDLNLVSHFCEDVIVMYAGKIFEKGSVEKIFSNPSHPYTQKLLQATPKMDTPRHLPLITIEGHPPDLSRPIFGCSFCDRCPFAMNICANAAPPLFVRSSEHLCACWLYDPRCQRSLHE
ncbi:MAG: ABC transporter ATP-binding protein [Rhabdochlamydiaceae bacterium]